MSRLLARLAVVMCTVGAVVLPVSADVYMHFMRGGNNRLNERGQERDNGDRLWDSQNNNRGGYNTGSILRPYYYEDTVIPIEWTQQHSCGHLPGNNCEMILQYTCGDKWVRDGSTTNTIPIDPTKCTDTDGDCDRMMAYGRHESVASYMNCRYRSRNLGLFTSNQNLEGDSARFTRQNNNGGRSGLECPEERDYYPYWGPTIWRDIAIITNRPSRCTAFQQESQNVKARFYCAYDPLDPTIAAKIAKNREGWLPITQAECEDPVKFPTGKWTRVEPFAIPQPDCVLAAYTRDNHLGNAVNTGTDPLTGQTNGFPNMYNWTIRAGPNDFSANCVLRLRYNISTGDFPFQGYVDDYNVTPGPTMDATSNMQPLDPDNPDDNARFPSMFPIWSQYGMTRDENLGSFTSKVQNDDANNGNDGEDGEGGIRQSQPPSRDYTLRNNPKVDIFGPLLAHNVSSIAAYNGQPMIRLRLAVNTAQYGRTFEDRSHTFEIRARPANLVGVKIHNLSVRGKKGNIVQVYPGVEYDFVPDQLHVAQGDMVHIQWTGSVPGDAEGQGNNGDRSNIVMLRARNYVEDGQSENTSPHIGQLGNSYPALINDTANAPAFLGFDFARVRMLALYGINSSHFDLGPVQVTGVGEYRYICTRNNAFSNRSHKGTLIVAANETWQALGPAGKVVAPLPVNLEGETWAPSGAAKLKQELPDDVPAGTEVVPGAITIDDATETKWFKVNPPVPNLGVAASTLYFEADRDGPSNFFYRGKVMWKLNWDDAPVEQVTDSSYYAAKNRIAIQNGGYYSSTSVPNTAMIAGITIGVIGLIAIFIGLYWKVRVQPEGGWKAFFAKDKLADTLLRSDGGDSTSSPAPVALQEVHTQPTSA